MDHHTQRTVLVTGATGFIANHIVLQLLNMGYQVRGTARTKNKETALRDMLAEHTDRTENFELVEANLEHDDGWELACKGCDYVIHVASPFPLKAPKHESEVILPATQGTLRVLSAAAKQGVKRVVMTSSTAAILYGQDRSQIFTEKNWSNIKSPKIGAYQKSKTLAEQAAWEFIQSDRAQCMELSVINPGLVFGPILSQHWSTSGELIRKFMSKEIPALPNMGWACVDVRDVATAHVSAMVEAKAAGERFICANEHASMQDLAVILKQHYDQSYKFPTRVIPDFLVRFVALFDQDARITLNDLGQRQDLDNSKIKQVLNWKSRSLNEAVTAMADSLIKHGVV